MKFDLKKPCSECPFTADSMRGWLGAYRDPQNVLDAILRRDEPFFCHPTINYHEDRWLQKAMQDGQHCAGALIFARKSLKLSRDNDIAEAQQAIDHTQEILFPAPTFIAHHTIEYDFDDETYCACFAEGQDAAARGVGECPYSSSSPHFEAWMDGHSEMKAHELDNETVGE